MVLSRSNGPQNVHEGRGGPPDVGLSESHMYSTPHGGEGHHQRPNGLQGPHYSDRGSRMRSGSSAAVVATLLFVAQWFKL